MKSNKTYTKTNLTKDNHHYISPLIYREIALHIFKNDYSNENHDFKTPLILAICGHSGVGKTYQTECILKQMSHKPYRISGAEFEDSHAGVPAKNFQQIYKELSDDIFYKKEERAVIVIDDFDAALGGWGDLVQYTMNRQLSIKTLIDLADNPYEITIREDDESRQVYETCRIPIIVTLNDVTKMYAPLMRNGRTKLFPWTPGKEEIEQIIEGIFSDVFLDFQPYELYEKLLEYASKMTDSPVEILPMSLFSDIHASLFDDDLWTLIQNNVEKSDIKTWYDKGYSSNKLIALSKAFSIGCNLIHINKNYL